VTAFVADWMIVVWLAVLSLFVRLPVPRYFELRVFELDGKIYERLGVAVFKQMVRRGPLSIFSRTLRLPREPRPTDLRALDHKLGRAEAIHLLAFIAAWPLTLYATLRAWFDATGWLLAFSVTINAYPVLLQRYNRAWLHRRWDLPLG